VIKIEAVGDGDVTRFAEPIVGGVSLVFAAYNTGKQSVSLDLKAPAGIAAAKALIASADIVVENFRPGVMKRLGLDYDSLAADHPRLIYCSVSGYGQTGPLAHKAAYAPVLAAFSGYDSVYIADQGGAVPPPKTTMFIADSLAAVYAFGAIQTALVQRERFGIGGPVDVTLLESMISLLAIQYQQAQVEGEVDATMFSPYKAADGYLHIPLVNPKNYSSVYETIGHPEWLADPDYTTLPALLSRRSEVFTAIADWAVTKSCKECEAAMLAVGIPCSLFLTPREVLQEPHVIGRGSMAPLTLGDGQYKVPNLPFRIGGSDIGARPDIPRAGEHTRTALLATGLSDAAITALAQAGAFGNKPV
jgi:crotonobetainyl-CoA:carnitine CoA-transferase CaiB-like acyl-CoA transferase